jgi:hypothetical protein
MSEENSRLINQSVGIPHNANQLTGLLNNTHSSYSLNDYIDNASVNIKRVETPTLGLGDVRQSRTAIPA